MLRLLSRNRTLSLLLLLATFVAGYLVLRWFYEFSGDFPFTQEVILVFLGAVATVLITAVLLNQQTELELRKEGQVLLLDRKADIYAALVEHVGEIVEKGRMSAEALGELRVLNHKLAMIASGPVIRHFNTVLDCLEEALRNDDISAAESREIMRAVAVLTFWMRRDLLGRIEGEDDAEILAAIKENNADLEDERLAG